MPIRNFRTGIHLGLCLILCCAMTAPDASGQVLNQCPGQVTIPWSNTQKIVGELRKQTPPKGRTLSLKDFNTLYKYHICIGKHYTQLLRKIQAQNCQAVLQEYFVAVQNLPTIQAEAETCEVPDNLRPPPS